MRIRLSQPPAGLGLGLGLSLAITLSNVRVGSGNKTDLSPGCIWTSEQIAKAKFKLSLAKLSLSSLFYFLKYDTCST